MPHYSYQVYYPITMYKAIYKPASTVTLSAMWFIMIAMLGTCIVATIGSIYGMAMASEGGH